MGFSLIPSHKAEVHHMCKCKSYNRKVKLLHKEIGNLLKAIEYCKTHDIYGGAL